LKTLSLFKADPLHGDKVENVSITIHLNMEGMNIEDHERLFDDQAKSLALVLFYSLPQGTYDKLIIELMKRKVSVYRGLTRS